MFMSGAESLRGGGGLEISKKALFIGRGRLWRPCPDWSRTRAGDDSLGEWGCGKVSGGWISGGGGAR
eukprot:1417761-Prymnesium_polylepis.1